MSDQERKCRFISTVHQAGPTLASVVGRDGGDRTWVAIVLCARASMQVDRPWAASCSCPAHAWDVQNVYESFGTVGACLPWLGRYLLLYLRYLDPGGSTWGLTRLPPTSSVVVLGPTDEMLLTLLTLTLFNKTHPPRKPSTPTHP